jgi:hypothetical protein
VGGEREQSRPVAARGQPSRSAAGRQGQELPAAGIGEKMEMSGRERDKSECV